MLTLFFYSFISLPFQSIHSSSLSLRLLCRMSVFGHLFFFFFSSLLCLPLFFPVFFFFLLLFFFFVLSALSACVSVQSVPFPLCLSACVPCCCLLCCFCFVDSLLFDCQCYPFFSQSPLLL